MGGSPQTSTVFTIAFLGLLSTPSSSFSPGISLIDKRRPQPIPARRTSLPKIMSTPASPSASDPPPCPASEARALNLFVATPLLRSPPLSRLAARPVYLKLDLLQPSGSFKDRGVAHLCCAVREARRRDGLDPRARLVSSSGGNAGLAVAAVASRMDLDASVVVPESAKPPVVERLRGSGARVTVHGKVWNEADALARRWVEEAEERGEGAVYVSPYDNPLLWTGHSTVVDEVISQLGRCEEGARIGAILASVGGGGLLAGILEGIERNYFDGGKRGEVVTGTKVVACETEGAASFAASFNASSSSDRASGKKEVNMVRLDGINSVATSLGALEVTPEAIRRAHRHQERGKESGNGEDVYSFVCTDKEAVDACVRFAADHRMLIEPACGASLAPLYSERLRSKLLEGVDRDRVIVVEVCGGSGVSLELLEGWRKEFL